MDRMMSAPDLTQTYPHGSIHRVKPRSYNPTTIAVNLGLIAFTFFSFWAVYEIAHHIYRALVK